MRQESQSHSEGLGNMKGLAGMPSGRGSRPDLFLYVSRCYVLRASLIVCPEPGRYHALVCAVFCCVGVLNLDAMS